MSDYIKTTDFAVKDSLASGHPDKVVSGVEINDELELVEVAVASKEDVSNKGAANGYAPLNSGGLVDVTDLPAVAYSVPRRTSGLASGEVLATASAVEIADADVTAGIAFCVFNNSSSNIALTEGAGVTIRLAGTTTTGDLEILPYGFASCWCNTGTEVIVMGNVVEP